MPIHAGLHCRRRIYRALTVGRARKFDQIAHLHCFADFRPEIIGAGERRPLHNRCASVR